MVIFLKDFPSLEIPIKIFTDEVIKVSGISSNVMQEQRKLMGSRQNKVSQQLPKLGDGYRGFIILSYF